jgi:hypothetical protein
MSAVLSRKARMEWCSPQQATLMFTPPNYVESAMGPFVPRKKISK